MLVVRNRFYKGLTIDIGQFPCPRCRSKNITSESGMAGQMATCKGCGARSSLCDWNDGLITLDRVVNKGHYKVVSEFYTRPSSEVVEKTNIASGASQKLYDEVTEYNRQFI